MGRPLIQKYESEISLELEELDVSNNQVRDISPLSGLPKLRALNLSVNLAENRGKSDKDPAAFIGTEEGMVVRK